MDARARLAHEIQLLEAETAKLKRTPHKTKEVKKTIRELDKLLKAARAALRKASK